MLTVLIAATTLANAPPFWEWHHVAIMVVTTLYLDALLIFAVVATWTSLAWVMGRANALDGLTRLARFLAGVDTLVFALGTLFLITLILVTFVSVVGRNVWAPIPDDITIAEWAMVATVAVMLGTTQGRGEHIEVTALADALPQRINRILRLMGALLGVVFIGMLALVNYPEVADSFLEETYGSIYALPLWPPRWIFFLGIAAWLARIYAQAVLLLADAVRPLPVDAAGRALDLTPLLPADSGGTADEAVAVEAGTLDKKERVGDGA